MASNDSRLDQSQSLTHAFESGEYSDLIIKCHEQTWHVHRVILCTRARYFKSCCKHNFKEGLSGLIELHEDDPVIVGKMLCYFYTCDWSGSGDDNFGDAIINVLVYAIADKYNVPLLKALAKEKFQNVMRSKNFKWNPDAFAGVCTQIYSTTPSSDRGLRTCAKHLMRKHKESLHVNKVFRSLLQASLLEGDFVLDVVDAWVN